jgi:hypothetical protein
MRSISPRNGLAGTLACAAVTAALAAPPAGAATRDAAAVPPPPSSIAAGEGRRYEKLRAAGAIHETSRPVAARPVPAAAPSGFDWASAAIGAAGIAGFCLVLAAGTRRRTAPGA